MEERVKFMNENEKMINDEKKRTFHNIKTKKILQWSDKILEKYFLSYKFY